MGTAWELVAGYVHNVSSTITQVTNVTGDSTQVRNFNKVNPAYLRGVHREGTTAGIIRVRSPLLHDNVKGYHVALSESPATRSMPFVGIQQVQPQDTLIVETNGESSGYDIAGISIYYTDLPGAGAKLFSWGDVKGLGINMVTVEVATTSASTPTAWTDTVITTTDNLLHANTDYAILGYTVDTAIGLVAVKGIDTSNLRVGGAGKALLVDTAAYFVNASEATGMPHIPVINSANAPSTYVSTLDTGSSTASNITLIMMELSQNLTK